MKEIKKQVVEWDDTLWVVKRMIPDSYKIDIPGYKEYLGADKVAKKNGYYFFLEEVKEVGIIKKVRILMIIRKKNKL
jgi:hypothetical protein